MDEVERSVIQHRLDLDRIDSTALQGTIEDVLNDILVIGSSSRLDPLRRSLFTYRIVFRISWFLMPELHHQRTSRTLIRVAVTTQTMDRDRMHCMFARHIIVPTTRQDMPIILILLEGHRLIFRVPICVLFLNQPMDTCQGQRPIMRSSNDHNPETQSKMSRREERQRKKRTAARRCRDQCIIP